MRMNATRRVGLLTGSFLTVVVTGALTGTIVCAESSFLQSLPNLFPLLNPSGFVETYNINNTPINLTGPFFQSLGANGRSCSSCHRPAEAPCFSRMWPR